MIINTVYKLVKYYIRKNRNGGMPSGEEVSALADTAQLNIINKNVKLVGMERYSFIADEISTIKKVESISISSGLFPFPSDFMYLMGLSHQTTVNSIVKTKDIDLLKDDEFNLKADSLIRTPSNLFPISKWQNKSWMVLPNTITTIKCTYIKKPETPKWAYTEVSGRPVFDEANSVDFELPKSRTYELAMEVLTQMGINVREQQIINYANEMSKDE